MYASTTLVTGAGEERAETDGPRMILVEQVERRELPDALGSDGLAMPLPVEKCRDELLHVNVGWLTPLPWRLLAHRGSALLAGGLAVASLLAAYFLVVCFALPALLLP